MKIKLTVWERLQIVPILNTGKGFKLEELKDVIEDAKIIMVSPEEQKEIKFKVLKGKNDKDEEVINGYEWDPKIAKEKEFTISEPVKKFLIKFFEEKEKSAGFSFADLPFVELIKKLK